jgi:hypothetical protein
MELLKWRVKMAKKLTASQVLTLMRRANPSNALKLTDPNEYCEIPISEFFSSAENLDLTEVERSKLERLKEEMTIFTNNKDKFYFHENKIYIYFILRLQEVLGL